MMGPSRGMMGGMITWSDGSPVMPIWHTAGIPGHLQRLLWEVAAANDKVPCIGGTRRHTWSPSRAPRGNWGYSGGARRLSACAPTQRPCAGGRYPSSLRMAAPVPLVPTGPPAMLYPGCSNSSPASVTSSFPHGESSQAQIPLLTRELLSIQLHHRLVSPRCQERRSFFL